MSVADARERISRPEFLRWRAFQRLFPFDDLHRVHRPAALAAGAAASRDKLDAVLDWLTPSPEGVLLEEELAGRSEVDKSIIRAFRAVGTKKRAPRKK